MAESDGWMTLSEIARVRGQDKAGVSRRVARLEAAGALTTRPGPGGKKMINTDEFARAVEALTDRTREANGRLAAEPRIVQTLTSARTVSEAHRSQLLHLELDEKRGKLMRTAKVEDALVAAGEKIVRIIDQPPMDADDLATSVARGGAQALRHALKEISRRMRTRIADALSLEVHST
jgi:DNA-binding MarR family transcriptional regulator